MSNGIRMTVYAEYQNDQLNRFYNDPVNSFGLFSL
jgi:hypothetical protein